MATPYNYTYTTNLTLNTTIPPATTPVRATVPYAIVTWITAPLSTTYPVSATAVISETNQANPAGAPITIPFTAIVTITAGYGSSTSTIATSSATAGPVTSASPSQGVNQSETQSQAAPSVGTGRSALPTTDASSPTDASTSSSTASLAAGPAAEHGSASTSTLSVGAVAGIAVGCLLAGLAVGLVAACLLLKRRYKRPAVAEGPVSHAEVKPYEDSGAASDIQLGQFLLEATPDRDIAREIQSLGELIRQHVESNYHAEPVAADKGGLERSLARLGFSDETETGPTRQLLVALCLDPKTRYAGLQHVILRVIFANIGVDPLGGHSLLPPPVAAFLQAIPSPEAHQANELPAVLLAISKWRVLSAFLLHPTRSMRTALPIERRALLPQAHALAGHLDVFLNYFVATDSGAWQAQVSHLEAVIMECAGLGYVLLSHPSNWRMVTEAQPAKPKRRGERVLVVQAGLEKLSDREGLHYSSPKRVVDPVVVSF